MPAEGSGTANPHASGQEAMPQPSPTGFPPPDSSSSSSGAPVNTPSFGGLRDSPGQHFGTVPQGPVPPPNTGFVPNPPVFPVDMASGFFLNPPVSPVDIAADELARVTKALVKASAQVAELQQRTPAAPASVEERRKHTQQLEEAKSNEREQQEGLARATAIMKWVANLQAQQHAQQQAQQLQTPVNSEILAGFRTIGDSIQQSLQKPNRAPLELKKNEEFDVISVTHYMRHVTTQVQNQTGPAALPSECFRIAKLGCKSTQLLARFNEHRQPGGEEDAAALDSPGWKMWYNCCREVLSKMNTQFEKDIARRVTKPERVTQTQLLSTNGVSKIRNAVEEDFQAHVWVCNNLLPPGGSPSAGITADALFESLTSRIPEEYARQMDTYFAGSDNKTLEAAVRWLTNKLKEIDSVPGNDGQSPAKRARTQSYSQHVPRQYVPAHSAAQAPPTPGSDGTSTDHCNTCGESGHRWMWCPQTLCYQCNEYGHTSFNCGSGDSGQARGPSGRGRCTRGRGRGNRGRGRHQDRYGRGGWSSSNSVPLGRRAGREGNDERQPNLNWEA